MNQTKPDLASLRNALLAGALVLDAPDRGTLVVCGKDRQTWLNGMVTCDLAPLKAGQGAYGFAVAKTGKILSELWIVLLNDRILIAAPRDRVETLLAHFDHYVIMEDVELSDESTTITWAVAHGPLAKDVAAHARESGKGIIAAVSLDTSGKGGAVFALSPATTSHEWLERLDEKEIPQVLQGDDESWETLRVEIGLARWGKDFGEENYPQEAALEELGVSFQKGCYLGQEAVFMLQTRGHVKKKIVSLSLSDTNDLPKSAEITTPEGTVVGSVTSMASSHENNQKLLLGFVKYKQAVKGTPLVVAGRTATVR